MKTNIKTNIITLALAALTNACSGGGGSSGGEQNSGGTPQPPSSSESLLAPTLLEPTDNPAKTYLKELQVSGQCTDGAQIFVEGKEYISAICTQSSFKLNLSEDSAGNYNYAIYQINKNNQRSEPLYLSWQIIETPPLPPLVLSPFSSPYYSSSSQLAISGSCANGDLITALGSGITAEASACADSQFTLLLNKAEDGIADVNIVARRVYSDDSELSSAPFAFTWYKDSLAPDSVQISNPTTSPYYSSGNLNINGSCENGATVILGGDAQQSTLCADSSFSFTITSDLDGTYSYSLHQVDLALNSSVSLQQQWVKDSSTPNPPTIVVPATSPYASNDNQLSLSGACASGYIVSLTDELLIEHQQVCQNGVYNFTLSKADGTHTFLLKQSLGSLESGTLAQTWIRDTQAPDTSFLATPHSTNFSVHAIFSFEASEAQSSTECKLNDGAYEPCTSPLVLSNLANGPYSLFVRATDHVGNIDPTPSVYSWSQAAFNTIALYRFDSPNPLVDFSLHANLEENGNLTNPDSAAVAAPVAQFGEAISLMNQAYVFAPHAQAHTLISKTLTIEAFINMPELPQGYAPIVSKAGPEEGTHSFEFGIKKHAGKSYRLYFKASADGNAFVEVISSNITKSQRDQLLSGFAHVAVTYDSGMVNFYFQGISLGSASISPTTLYPSSAQLRIGYNGTNYLNANIDELRLSQVVRTITMPTEPYPVD